jgi:hypothetical protein
MKTPKEAVQELLYTHKIDGLGELLELAESYGWIDPDYLPWTPENADETEENAADFLLNNGVKWEYIE